MRVTLPQVLFALAPLAGVPLPDSWPPPAETDWAAWRYQLLEDAPAGDYLVIGEVRGQKPGRVAFNLADEGNHYALELGPRVRLVRVEQGLELEIGAAQGKAARGSGGQWREFVVRCEDGRVDAFLGGEWVAAATDATFPAGKVGWSTAAGAEFRDLRVQETTPAYLDDDFMRAEGETGGWELVSGNWRVQSVGSPVRSTNAFNFTVDGAPEGGTALCGDWFQHDYEVSVSCQPHGPSQAGLYGCYQGERRFVRFACGRTTGKMAGVAELLEVREGKRRVLARAEADLAAGQWYRLGLRVEGARVTGLIDGHPVATAVVDASARLGGRVGLYAATAEGVTFDDFTVRQTRGVDWAAEGLELWQPVGGTWQAADGGAINGSAEGAAKLLLRQAIAGDVRIVAEAAGAAGLVAGWEDEQNYHALLTGGGTARLVTVTEGQAGVQAEAPLPESEGPAPMELSIVGPTLRGKVGEVSLSAANGVLPRGRVGLLVGPGTAQFRAPVIERLGPLPEAPRFEGAFTDEVSMADWAAENADWATVDAAAGDPGPSYWHKAPAYGDQELAVRLAAAPTGPVAVRLAGEEIGSGKAYSFTVTPGGTAALLRAGRPVASETLPGLAPEAIGEVALGRRGPLLIGSVNRRPVLFYRDAEPLTGHFAGWTAPAGVATPADATFRAANVLSYSFREAPSDWWVGSGDWRITNRWDCEPRWTFFIGGGEQVACLWNKHELGDDLTLDFYSAIRFDSTQGYEYRYASDINCTIAADGRDLTSGYSLMFGGWDNQYTRLLRGSEVVAESASALIPRSSSIHRQWFNLRVQKSGGRIRCWLDGQPLFDYTDPSPLTGKHVALWTYHNAIAVARVRIASNEVRPGRLTPPEAPPRCPYDVTAQ
jgi:hypothetical protein